MNKFTRFTAVVALMSAFAIPAIAAPVTYVVDNAHTFPRFSYGHLGLSTQLSKFDRTTGTVVYDQAARTASVDITIDTRSVNTGFATFDEHIQGEDFLDTGKYPTATFKSTGVDFAGDKPTAIHGNLTIKGITRPVTLQVGMFTSVKHPMLGKDAIGADASTVIKRTEFNAGKYAPNVGDDLTITIALEAVAR